MYFLQRDHTSGVMQCHYLHGRESRGKLSRLFQGCTNPEHKVVRATEFCAVASDICWPSVWTSFMSPAWCLEFWGSTWIFGKFVEKVLAFNGTLMIITVCTGACRLCLYWSRWIQSLRYQKEYTQILFRCFFLMFIGKIVGVESNEIGILCSVFSFCLYDCVF